MPLYVYADAATSGCVVLRDIVILLRSPSGVSDKSIEVLSSMAFRVLCNEAGIFSSMEVELFLDFPAGFANREGHSLAAVLRRCGAVFGQ